MQFIYGVELFAGNNSRKVHHAAHYQLGHTRGSGSYVWCDSEYGVRTVAFERTLWFSRVVSIIITNFAYGNSALYYAI